jgi:hypothetical protein
VLVVPPLEATLTISDRVTLPLPGYTVNVSITNSAATAQTWQNVAVHLGGLNLVVKLIGSAVGLDLRGADVCAVPMASATVAGGQTVTFSFTVRGSVLAEPTAALLNQATCD